MNGDPDDREVIDYHILNINALSPFGEEGGGRDLVYVFNVCVQWGMREGVERGWGGVGSVRWEAEYWNGMVMVSE